MAKRIPMSQEGRAKAARRERQRAKFGKVLVIGLLAVTTCSWAAVFILK